MGDSSSRGGAWTNAVDFFENLKPPNMKKSIALLSSIVCTAVAAFGHGSMADPISRSYEVFLENPMAPQSAAAKAAVAAAGTQAFYD
jgi:predicted carbohydrate-binding protein with CBM5 and CBM33 domain